MANPQHILWLLEGVESWNARRQWDDFVPDFEGADLSNLSFPHANFAKSKMNNIFMENSRLNFANFSQAELTNSSFERSNLTGAVFDCADLYGASFIQATLARASMLNVDFSRKSWPLGKVEENISLYGADVRTFIHEDEADSALMTDLNSWRYLSQSQIDQMRGDIFTILPKSKIRPIDWEKDPNKEPGNNAPTVPPKLAGDQVSFDENAKFKLTAETNEAYAISLNDIFIELQASLTDAKNHLNLDNLSKSFHQALERFLSTLTDDLADLPQIRFGISARTMTLRLDGEREHLGIIAPEKVGHLDAIVYLSNLLAARLPDFQEFLEQEQPARAIAENAANDMQEILSASQVAIAGETELFDESISERLSEYINSMTIEGYLAAKNILLNIAQRTFLEVQGLLEDTVTTSRKIAVTLTATTVVTALGASLLKISKLFGSRLDWIDDWLTFLTKTFGF